MNKPRVLYIASSSVNDPLVISQVLRYLPDLSGVFGECHLLTLERKEVSVDEANKISGVLAKSGIHWQPLKARGGSRSINIWRDIAGGYRKATALIREHDLNVVHARSFIPGNIALRACKKTGAKLLYDMRGFWAEEKFAKGTIRRPWMLQMAQQMENRLFDHADALVSLTEAGKIRLLDQGVATPIDVIPCCVDTNVFQWDGRNRTEVKRIVSVGSLGPGYLPDAVFGVFAAAQKRWPGVKLQLLTRTDRGKVDQAAGDAGCDVRGIDVTSANPREVPRFLHEADIGLCMIQPSTAKIASSPTKLAEYFACGVPVIANCDGIGDMNDIVLGNRVGVNLSSIDPAGYSAAVAQVEALMSDTKLSQRCVALAENEFSVQRGAKVYGSIYRRVTEATS